MRTATASARVVSRAGAPMATGRFPVILLSHGALGAATNYAWIAERLARSAFVVVGVSHFGESRVFGEATINPATVADFGARTRDFSFALEFVLQRSKWASGVNGGRVGALGHSSGGATVAMLAGGQYRPEAMAAFCVSKEGTTDRGCGYRAGASTQTTSAPPTAESRVRAVVLLDPAVGPGFDRPGLARVKAPALVIRIRRQRLHAVRAQRWSLCRVPHTAPEVGRVWRPGPRIRQDFFECSPKAAPCGSIAFTTRSPSGTSIGPLRIFPPPALMRSTAASTSGTRK